MSIPKALNLKLIDITEENRKDKLQKAIKTLSKELQVPATIKIKENSNKEKHPFLAQEELYNLYKLNYGNMLDDLYSRVCSTLGMTPSNTFKKAIDPNAPKMGKEIFWNPETGLPITQKDLDRLLIAVDKFMNRGNIGKEFTISQSAVARIIANMRKNTELAKLRKKKLADIKIKETLWSDINSYEKLNDVFPDNYDRLKIYDRIIGNNIQDVTDTAKKGIRDILDRGFLAGKSKSDISQDLFDKFGSLNRNWDIITDTEGTNVFNSEYIGEQISETEPGEAVYFVRREYNDAKTCNFCVKAAEESIIAKWSDVPLNDENIDDPIASIALWSGKTNYGVARNNWEWSEGSNHPYCRGYWDRYYPEIGDIKL